MVKFKQFSKDGKNVARKSKGIEKFTILFCSPPPSKIKLQQTNIKANRKISDSWNESRKRKK